jgi:hypothetical protein
MAADERFCWPNFQFGHTKSEVIKMASPFSNALNYAQNQQYLAEQINARRAAAVQAAAERQNQLRMQQQWITWRMQNGPTMQRFTAQQQADKANLDFVTQLDPSKVEPGWRTWLSAVQASLKQNPDPAVAKAFINKYRPAGLQLKLHDVYDPTSGTTSTEAYLFDPYAPSLPTARTGAATAPAGAGTGGPSAAASAVMSKYGALFGGTP